MPESAVYEALNTARVPHTPQLFDSGIIAEDSFVYRVEYLIIEDCGMPLAEYLTVRSGLGVNKLSDVTARVMSQIAKCLSVAWKAGILHRDISAGNKVVKNDQTGVIDWGYTKFANGDPENIDVLASKWKFNSRVVMNNERLSAPMTGSPLYMSIPVLVGDRRRSVAGNIESALYVALDALSGIQSNKTDVIPIGMQFHNSQNLAIVRGCCMADADLYKPALGISQCSELFGWLSDTVRKYLFIRSDKYIGSKLALDPDFGCMVEPQQLEQILEAIGQRVFGRTPTCRAQTDVADATGEDASVAI